MKLYYCSVRGCKLLASLFCALFLLSVSTSAQAKKIKEWLYWNNYLEWEAYSTQAPNVENDAGSSLSSFSTGFDAYYEKFSGHVYAVYREDITEPAEIERVQLAWAPQTWLTLSAGQNYLPFAYINTLSVSYAPTASLGLTFRENIALSLNSDMFYLSTYTYKTDLKYWDIELVDGATNKTFDHYGADFTFSVPGDVLSVGASYMSNLGDSDFFALVFPGYEYMIKKVPVSAVYASLFWKRLGLIVEIIEANKTFSEYDFGGDIEGLRPRATNAELAIYASPDSWALIGYRTTDQAAFTGLPSESYVGSYTNAFYKKHIYIGFELSLDKSYSSEYTGFRRLSSHGFAFKLAVNY